MDPKNAYDYATANPKTDVCEGEIWDVLKLTHEVAKLCAEHAGDAAIVFAATPINTDDDTEQAHVAAVFGGAQPSHRCYGDMIMALNGKLFQANFQSKAAGMMVVHRDREGREHDDA